MHHDDSMLKQLISTRHIKNCLRKQAAVAIYDQLGYKLGSENRRIFDPFFALTFCKLCVPHCAFVACSWRPHCGARFKTDAGSAQSF